MYLPDLQAKSGICIAMSVASYLQLITGIHKTEDCFYRLTTKPPPPKFN